MTACGTQQPRSGRTPAARTSRTSEGGTLRPTALNDGISPLLSANFVLLHAPPDAIPLTLIRPLAHSIPEMRWNLARRIPVSLTGKYWLVPGVAKICVVAMATDSPTVGAVCASVTQALHHGVASTSLDPTSGQRVIVGAVPTGTRTVLVRSGGTTSSVRAFHGHFVLRDSVAAPPDELMLRQ